MLEPQDPEAPNNGPLGPLAGPPAKQPDDRRQSWVTLYQETWSEIKRLREYEWKIAYYFTSLSVGLLILKASSLEKLLSGDAKWIVAAIQVVAAVFCVLYLKNMHGHLIDQRLIRSKLELVLGFHGRWRRLKSGTVLPGKYKHRIPPADARPETLSFGKWVERQGLFLPLSISVVAVQMFTIYLILTSG